MNNKLLGTVAIGTAAYLMKNKEARDTMMNQLQKVTNIKSQNGSKSRSASQATVDPDLSVQPNDKMSGKTKMLGALAVGAAAYMMRNQQARQKLKQITTMGIPEKMAQKKNRQSFLKANKNMPGLSLPSPKQTQQKRTYESTLMPSYI
ncbi:hypothetical protein [Bacillus sp. V5-8f]|uniref:hypothetical protein n=1 Tax=Bacillus sp. V5-8f TaxID=2053044 RepID=UPI000C77E14D|nr:hypothetical protein [Bacillus sp. V5-8f]PLT32771.1 hypothetical protein CUU64_16605 [Bacillus sp. V5-8f]